MSSTGTLVAGTIGCTTEPGLAIIDAADAHTRTIIKEVPVTATNTCSECGQAGVLRDHIIRTLIDLPIVGFPTQLRVPRHGLSATLTSAAE